ncbi:MAG: ABC transporter substrate-binding protein, partial [Terriglobales bacterium]
MRTRTFGNWDLGFGMAKGAARSFLKSQFLNPKSQVWVCALVIALCTATRAANELRFCLKGDPKTFNPLLVDDDDSDTVVYLTGGVLVRINRQTQLLEPELATEWKVSKDGRTITFTLREHVFFSDGTPFGPEDVAFTVKEMLDPALHSPIGDSFRSGTGATTTKVPDARHIAITFPAPVAGLDRLFDGVAILSSRSPKKEMATLGPYYVGDHKAGSYVLLNRNPNYWKRDSGGRQLPYIETIRLGMQSNRDIEMLQFKNGEIHLINSIDTEYYDRLAASSGSSLHDAGPSSDTEQVWFNQVPTAPIEPYKRAWFRSQNFRVAVSKAINRDDLARVVFGSHARPAVGPVSPANKLWFNAGLKPIPHDPNASLKLLQA